jgi:hypothetical protein
MARTVIALYEDFASANAAVRDLVDHGFPRDDISIMASDAAGEYGKYLNRGNAAEGETGAASGAGIGAGVGAVVGGLGGLLVGLGALAIPGIGPVLAAGPLAAALTGLAGAGAGAVAGGVTGGLIGALVDMGVPEETAGYYAEGIRRGGTLVTVRTEDNMAESARDIMNHHNPIDINERATQWRQAGWTGFDVNATPNTTTAVDRDRGMAAADMGQPNQVYGATGAAPGTTGTTGADYPTEDVTTHAADFNTYTSDFRNHFSTTMAGTGYTFEQYEPAYRYGYDLATNDRYRNRSWSEVEPEARQYWNERNPGTWDQVKGAVQHAWDEVKNAI